ncbi:ATP-binding cassette domain-containing protein [Acetobacter orientalis]|uniref:sulfate/molybdate ABC transporter ATP-binding protein n=1 Tax=Acetobacter orientalis TaxID=146474 RepID=UPI0020A06712|nr:ATP-binding cassette domain-containing protein [Acetobacter orientalis]MCP1217503.1 ATP-binding cassette domain-containing protein [Acetobacter orientalis]
MSILIQNLVRHAPATERRLLDDVTLAVPSGAFVALVGPSGAGKTTLLRAIAGLDHYSSGTIDLDGNRLENLHDRAGKIGFVFQNYALFPHMTVARNISFGLDVLPREQRPKKAEITARVQDLLDLMQLSGMGKAYPARLSGGQRQRVALARALATGPGVLLLDEPFGALDPIVRRAIRTWLRTLHDQLGLTTILVTHDQEEALEVADRIVVMQQGRIVQDASPATLDEAPNTPFVMQFLGEVVSFSGHIKDGVFTPSERGVAPCAVSEKLESGPAELMIRPFEIGLRQGQGAHEQAVELALYSKRQGFCYYSAHLPQRTVPVFIYNTQEEEQTRLACAELEIQRGKLFRDGVRLQSR